MAVVIDNTLFGPTQRQARPDKLGWPLQLVGTSAINTGVKPQSRVYCGVLSLLRGPVQKCFCC